MGGQARALLAALALAALIGAPAHAAGYGENDGGGFRNILPPGEAGADNAIQLAQYEAGGSRPPHWEDQQPLYVNLLYAPPQLTDSDVARYFKDATFGVKPGMAEPAVRPRPGTTILRDSAFGVPHVYGTTRADVEFGAGYAAAQDRLFLMDVLRHAGRAQLSSFAGGADSNREMDRAQWEFAPYTEADLQRQLDQNAKLYGAAGQQVIDDVTAYVAGINQYIGEAQLDPTKMPSEYAALGQPLQPWKLTDVVATASLIGAEFGGGGGREVQQAQLLQALQRRFGARGGRRVWADLREKNDPEAPTVISKRFPYRTKTAYGGPGAAMPDPGSVHFVHSTPDAAASGGDAANAAARHPAVSYFHIQRGASNAMLVSARKSADRKPIAFMGPEVGFYVPQVLMEEDLHGPGFDAEGATFPGVSEYVLLGHGRDYAWSATSAYSDVTDTFAEPLCQDADHYVYQDQCTAMETLTRTNSWVPNASDQTGPGSETLTVQRTVHGIVYARGTVGGKPVAFVRDRSTYMHEGDSALFFQRMNDPGQIRGPGDFLRAGTDMNFAFNWFYVDPKHIAYYHSGWYPRAAKGTAPDFPMRGGGDYDWAGLESAAAHPQAIDPPYLVSWNNKPAPGWAAADDNLTYGPLYHSQLLSDKVARMVRGKRRTTLPALVHANITAATQDFRTVRLLPVLLRAVGRPRDVRLRAALGLLRDWRRYADAQRIDRNKDGHFEDDAAITLMDAWWPKVAQAVLPAALGPDAVSALDRLLGPGDTLGGEGYGPEWDIGWYSYVQKDLRDTFARRSVRGRFSRGYCGGGSRKRCRAALQASLRAALSVTRADLYGHDQTCADEHRVEAACFNENRSQITSAIDMPPFPFMNRPTFQQAVEVGHAVPR